MISGVLGEDLWAYFTKSVANIPHRGCNMPLTTYCPRKRTLKFWLGKPLLFSCTEQIPLFSSSTALVVDFFPEILPTPKTQASSLCLKRKTRIFYKNGKGSPSLCGVQFLFSLSAKNVPNPQTEAHSTPYDKHQNENRLQLSNSFGGNQLQGH